MITKRKRKEFIENLFTGCNNKLYYIDGDEIIVSIWCGMYYTESLNGLIKIMTIIENSEFIESSYDVFRTVGYYDSTDDITINFRINKELVKEKIK